MNREDQLLDATLLVRALVIAKTRPTSRGRRLVYEFESFLYDIAETGTFDPAGNLSGPLPARPYSPELGVPALIVLWNQCMNLWVWHDHLADRNTEHLAPWDWYVQRSDLLAAEANRRGILITQTRRNRGSCGAWPDQHERN